MSDLPNYVVSAKPVPLSNRAPWYKTIAPTYAGVMLWFVFWNDLVKGNGTPGGVLSAGLGVALLSLLAAALICHLFFYLVPATLGMKTGLPLYVVGTSTYGARGGFLMPGLLMGLLQFGWLAVNGFAVSGVLCECFGIGMQLNEKGALVPQVPGLWHGAIAAAFVVLAAFVGLKGIQYVARVATWLPLIPLVLLVILVVKTSGGLSQFSPEKVAAPKLPQAVAHLAKDAQVLTQRDTLSKGLTVWGVFAVVCTYVVGFFATAGAAGTDIASSARGKRDVHLGGLAGIVLSTMIAGGGAILIIAGVYGAYQPEAAHNLIAVDNLGDYKPVKIMYDILDMKLANIAMIGLAIASFPGACFSSLIAANSFKTTMPKINPSISVGIGALVAAVLAVTGVAGKSIEVFQVIGASFGPICGAMLADYLLAEGKWSGPRAGFNPAGWLSWFVGFVVGAFNLVVTVASCHFFPRSAYLASWKELIPIPPVAAFAVGFVLYYLLARAGCITRKLDMPQSPAE